MDPCAYVFFSPMPSKQQGCGNKRAADTKLCAAARILRSYPLPGGRRTPPIEGTKSSSANAHSVKNCWVDHPASPLLLPATLKRQRWKMQLLTQGEFVLYFQKKVTSVRMRLGYNSTACGRCQAPKATFSATDFSLCFWVFSQRIEERTLNC